MLSYYRHGHTCHSLHLFGLECVSNSRRTSEDHLSTLYQQSFISPALIPVCVSSRIYVNLSKLGNTSTTPLICVGVRLFIYFFYFLILLRYVTLRHIQSCAKICFAFNCRFNFPYFSPHTIAIISKVPNRELRGR